MQAVWASQDRLRTNGVLGLKLGRALSDTGLLGDALAGWEPWAVDQVVGTAHATTPMMDERRVRMALSGGGALEIDRERARSLLTVPRLLTDDALVHPYLGPTAAAAAHWRGDACLHAGAFLIGDGAWALLGDKGDGKSSTLAWLDRCGYGVLSDDMLVVDREGRALAGPRCVDLRATTAALLPQAQPLGLVGARERFRLRTAEAPAAVRLRGWVVLAWSDDDAPPPHVTTVAPGERVAILARQLAVRRPPKSPDLLLRLAQLPMWRLARARRLDALDDTVATLGSLAER